VDTLLVMNQYESTYAFLCVSEVFDSFQINQVDDYKGRLNRMMKKYKKCQQ